MESEPTVDSVHVPSAVTLPKLDTKSRARKAMAELEQKREHMTASAYRKAKRDILRALKKFGVSHKATLSISHPELGKIEIRHLADRLVHGHGEAVALSDSEGTAPVWIQLGRAGVYRGHPAGPFVLNAQIFSEIVRNFYATENRQVAIDFEHASEMNPTDGTVPQVGAPAQGWIVELKHDGQALWGLVEWGELARQYIREKKYKYISPAIRFSTKDRVTGQQIGARLTSAGLTNIPFLDGMQPLAAKDSNMSFAYSSHEYMPAIRKALGLSDMATAKECSDHLARLEEHYENGGGEPVHGVDVPGYVGSLRSMLNTPMTSTVKEIFDSVKALIRAAIEEHEALQHPLNADVDDEDEDTDMSETLAKDASQPAMEIPKMDIEKREAEFAAAMSEKAAESAALSLRLKDAEARAEQASVELSELRAWRAEREANDLKARVDDAFETYAGAKKLTDADRDGMLIVLKSDAALFDKLYPRVRKSEQTLMNTITAPAPAAVRPAAPAAQVSLADRAKKLMLERGLSFEHASQIAARGV